MFGMTADNLGTLLTGIGLALIALLGGKGVRNAASGKSHPAGEQTMEIAGAIISDKKANEIIAALNGLQQSLDGNTKACNAMGHKLEPLSEILRDLAKEYEIASRLGRK